MEKKGLEASGSPVGAIPYNARMSGETPRALKSPERRFGLVLVELEIEAHIETNQRFRKAHQISF